MLLPTHAYYLTVSDQTRLLQQILHPTMSVQPTYYQPSANLMTLQGILSLKVSCETLTSNHPILYRALGDVDFRFLPTRENALIYALAEVYT
jgi:hypothetical protein